jgi:uncharacterized protein (TIGR00369 family)
MPTDDHPEDQAQAAEDAAATDGADGAAGPTDFHGLIGLELTAVGDDQATATLDAVDRHLNGHGTVHGGALATLADSAMGAAVADGDNAPVTVEMTMTYLEAAKPGTITAQARVRRRGSRITIVEAEITDADDLNVAHAIATFTLL